VSTKHISYPSDGYLKNLPGGLRRAFASGRWLPIIGAGLSATATTPDRRSPPTWAGLRDKLSADLPRLGDRLSAADLRNASTISPIDIISTFADTYGRASLIERLTEVLLIDHAEPSDVHHAFAQLPFDMVVTTNVDFLLEEAYAERGRPCVPLIGEAQLSIQQRPEVTNLLKVHGDLRHPDNLVMTEEDYDGFIRRNPLLATYLSWWLLTREPIFIGYSLDDADLREVLLLLRERLGRMSRPSWVILATDRHNEARKFERRGVRPIVLHPDPDADRAVIFRSFFEELRSEWENSVVNQIEMGTDARTAEVVRSRIAPQLALFVAEDSTLALFREFVFPSVLDTGFLPGGIDAIRTQVRATKPMAIDVALSKAAVVVYDVSRRNPTPLDYVRSRRDGGRVIIVNSSDESFSSFRFSRDEFGDSYTILSRSASVDPESWEKDLLKPLLRELTSIKKASAPDTTVSQHLRALRQQSELMGGEDERNAHDRISAASKQLLLACLALLESQLRTKSGLETDSSAKAGSASKSDTAGKSGAVPGEGKMSRMRDFFEKDFDVIVSAIQLRHAILQPLEVDASDISKTAQAVYAVVQDRLPHFTQ
jgi:hypothetical protein